MTADDSKERITLTILLRSNGQHVVSILTGRWRVKHSYNYHTAHVNRPKQLPLAENNWLQQISLFRKNRCQYVRQAIMHTHSLYHTDAHTLTRNETKRWRTFTWAQQLVNSQLNLPHGTKQKRLMKKLKIKTEMLRRNGPVIKPWSQSGGRHRYYQHLLYRWSWVPDRVHARTLTTPRTCTHAHIHHKIKSGHAKSNPY